MPFSRSIFLIIFTTLVVLLPGSGVHAFGAGNIPSYAYIEGRAFRHGDIEDTLSDLAKKAGGFALGALIGKGGTKFTGLDVKRVYFGNWLRDYSQAVDIGSLKKVPLQTIINMCIVLGLLAHGYATNEFEVTVERLGVYLPVEHIDNPKGYGNGEDARQYDSRLRGPVNPAELEVDPRTGMKNYIANEDGRWDTSKAVVRRTLERCIHLGRQHRAQGRKQDEYEAYRLLGQALHTLEDFTAHSNFCELALVSMGHSNVFVHVGNNVRIQAPNGRWVAPLVTGTFGSSDFMYSLLGEASDHLSEASVSDLNNAMDSARSRSMSEGPSQVDAIRDLLFKLPGGAGSEISRDMEGMERIRNAPAYGGKPPGEMSPQELHSVLWKVLVFKDSVSKKIENTIEKIPGLGSLIAKISDSISVFVLSTLEPYLKPLLSTASKQLMAASSEVVNNQDQYEVFNNSQASDPTHSLLSKDHFDLILNEPAGNIAKIIVRHTVMLVAKAWDDNSMNVRSTTDEILQCLFHPDFQNHSSQIQREMLGGLNSWLQSLGYNQGEILARLSKQAVRDHKNVRPGGSGTTAPPSQGSANAGTKMQANVSKYLHGIPGVSQAQGLYNQVGGGSGIRRGGIEPGASGASMDPMSGGSSQPYIPYSSAPVPPLPQEHTRPPQYPDSRYESTYGYQAPAQSSFGGGLGGSPYSFPGSSYTDPGFTPQYSGGPPPSSSGPSYPESSYHGQSSYPGQQVAGYGGMSGPGNDNPAYNQPPPSFPGAAPGFQPPGAGGLHFPGSQNESSYGAGNYGGYGHGTYQPEY